MLKNPAKTVAEITTFQFTSDITAAVPTVATKSGLLVLIARYYRRFHPYFCIFTHKTNLRFNLLTIYIRKKTYMVSREENVNP